jgi:hypothetical protein
MGLMDKVKAQATQLADMAQQAGQAGQAKIADIQAKRKGDALLLELGGITYTQRMGRADANADRRGTEIVALVQAFEAENGPIQVTSANATTAETPGVADPAGTIPTPTSTAPAPAAGPVPKSPSPTGES